MYLWSEEDINGVGKLFAENVKELKKGDKLGKGDKQGGDWQPTEIGRMVQFES
jgi:hypothetical protein